MMRDGQALPTAVRIRQAPQKVFPIILHFFTTTDNQRVMKREPIFPQHFHNNFICWEAKGNKAPEMAFKTL
jgi:hypothetical protein